MVRISGFASGMDIDDIVSKMMQAQRVPLDKMTQKKQYNEWQRDDYRSMNSALLELDRQIFDGIGKQSSFVKKAVNVSNQNALSIKSTGATVDFSGMIQINKLATSALMTSTTAAIGVTNATKFAGQTITIKAINKDGTFDQVFTYEIKPEDTLDTIISKINAESGVNAFYDEKSQKLSITAKNTGKAVSGSEIELFSTGDFFTKLNMSLSSTAAAAANSGTVGQNAQIKYNGLDIERASNTFTINGVEFTLKEAKPGETISFSSTADVEAILDTVTKFVNKYNEIIEKIKDKTTESRYRKFAPLTSDQKKAMTENEVKLWEEKAKSGTLRNDSTLKNLMTTMRTSLYTSVSGLTGFKDLSELGITTTKSYLDGGKLTIDEDKLREAINGNPDGMYQLFMAVGDKDDKDTQGLARRLRSDLKSAMDAITETAGKAGYVNNNFTIGKSLDNLDKRISVFEQKLVGIENRYYAQFTAMEKAIQKANSQSASLMQYFS